MHHKCNRRRSKRYKSLITHFSFFWKYLKVVAISSIGFRAWLLIQVFLSLQPFVWLYAMSIFDEQRKKWVNYQLGFFMSATFSWGCCCWRLLKLQPTRDGYSCFWCLSIWQWIFSKASQWMFRLSCYFFLCSQWVIISLTLRLAIEWQITIGNRISSVSVY